MWQISTHPSRGHMRPNRHTTKIQLGGPISKFYWSYLTRTEKIQRQLNHENPPQHKCQIMKAGKLHIEQL